MKKLGKLTINPEKVIKNGGLVNLKGGYFVLVCQSTEEFWGCGEDIQQCIQECYDCCPGDCHYHVY